MDDLHAHVQMLGRRARSAGRQLANLDGRDKTDALRRIAAGLREGTSTLLAANAPRY